MGYSKSTYKKAREIIDERRTKAKNTSIMHDSEVKAKIPELRQIDIALAETASDIISAILSGKEGIDERIEKIKRNNLALQEERKQILIFNGYPENYTDINYYCPKCEDTGFVGLNQCECLKRELARITIQNSGIGDLVNTQSFENFDLKYYENDPRFYEIMKQNLTFLKTYAGAFNDNTRKSLLFLGETGLGKTHLSTACAKVIINRGFEVVYDTAQNILSDFEQEKFGKEYNSERTEKLTDKYFSCDLLIIDDLGTELTNSFTVSTLYNLINSRINSNKPMIISTNLTRNDILSRYDNRIASRMIGEFAPIAFYGRDIRMQKLNS